MTRAYINKALIFGLTMGWTYALISLLWQSFVWSMVWWNPLAFIIAYVGMDYINGNSHRYKQS